MKKVKIAGIMILMLFTINSFSQQQVSGYEVNIERAIKRVNWNLVVIDTISWKNIKLEKEQLKMIFSDKQFRDYKTARNCYVASIPLLTVSACGIAITAGFLGAGIRAVSESGWKPKNHIDPRFGLILAGVTFGITLIPLIPGVVLIAYGAKQLNKIAFDYNVAHHLSNGCVAINFELTDLGFGMNINF